MLEFFKSHKFKIIIAVIALLFGMMLYSASSDGIANIPRNLLEMVTTPVQKAASFVAEKTGGFFDRFFNAKENAEENEALKEEIAELRNKLVDYEKLKDENENLKESAEIKSLNPDFEITMASIVSRDPSDRYGAFIIDRGSLHGVQKNDPVMTRNGLVGIITKVGPTSSRVKTILSPEINVSALEITTKELGMLKGDVKLSEEGLTKFSIMAAETEIEPGAIITTAGASGLYPKDIPIGTVQEILTEPHGVTKYAIIRPFDQLDELDNVQVITNFLGQGSEQIGFDSE